MKLEWRKKKPKLEYSVFDDVIDQLAAINGIEDAYRFYNPSKDDLHDPYLLKNVTELCERIIQAIHNNEKISIFADCDCDGISGTAIMYNYIKMIYDNVAYFHVQRSSGHGLEKALHKVPEDTGLLLIVDSSTSSDEACREVKNKGIDVLVIDHHPPDNPNPFALIVNPQLDDYPNKEISGAGLAWKVCKVLDDLLEVNYADNYIDICGVGMVGDMMDMLDLENRYIVNDAINNFQNKGLLEILKKKNKNPLYINSTDIAFTITPMLNACTRKDKMELGLELLTCNDDRRCKELVKEIEQLNENRKSEQSAQVESYKDQINLEDNVVIIRDDNISKGYSGLVANQLAQTYKRPALIIIKDKNKEYYNVSYRSFADYPLKDFFGSLPMVKHVGGHQFAGGAGFYSQHLETFITAVKEGLKNEVFEQVIEYDLEVDSRDVTEEFVRKVKRLYKVCGKNFPEARFLIKGLFVSDVQQLGENKETVKVDCGNLKVMKFRTNQEFYDQFPFFSNIDVIGTLNTNFWFNFSKKKMEITNQVFLDDYRVVV